MSEPETLAEDALKIAVPASALPLTVWNWIKARAVPALLILAAIIAIVALAAFAINFFSGDKRAAVVASVSSAATSAMTTSAADAVSVVESQGAAEQTTDRSVTHALSAVQSSSDSTDADAAGRSGLCAISPGLCAASGVQQPAAH